MPSCSCDPKVLVLLALGAVSVLTSVVVYTLFGVLSRFRQELLILDIIDLSLFWYMCHVVRHRETLSRTIGFVLCTSFLRIGIRVYNNVVIASEVGWSSAWIFFLIMPADEFLIGIGGMYKDEATLEEVVAISSVVALSLVMWASSGITGQEFSSGVYQNAYQWSVVSFRLVVYSQLVKTIQQAPLKVLFYIGIVLVTLSGAPLAVLLDAQGEAGLGTWLSFGWNIADLLLKIVLLLFFVRELWTQLKNSVSGGDKALNESSQLLDDESRIQA